MRSFGHRLAVYVGVRSDEQLEQDWEQDSPDIAVQAAVWALPLIAVLVAVGAIVWLVATTALLRRVVIVLAALFVLGLLREFLGSLWQFLTGRLRR
jgi:hypothetical protein